MNFEEELEELLALLAVAMNIPPEQFPAWSDGPMAHMAALAELWAEVRRHLTDAAKEMRLDERFHQLFAAFTDGDGDKGQRIAESLFADLASLR